MNRFPKAAALTLTLALSTFLPQYDAQARPSVYPTGTTIFSPEQAQGDVFILIATDEFKLIDRNGNVYHEWKMPYTLLSSKTQLDSNGNLLIAGSIKPEKATDYYDLHESFIAEFDWNGKMLWRFQLPENMSWHNEVRKLRNGNVVVPAYMEVPKEFHDKIENVETPWRNYERKGASILGDVIVEFDPKTGKIVNTWNSWEHLDLNKFCPVALTKDWTHFNTIRELPENKWYDAGDTRFKPGNYLINPRNLDTFYIIDRETGNVAWKGNHSYRGGLAHGHEPQMIEKGLPGEGNILFFDNGTVSMNRYVGSMVGELNPTTGELEFQYNNPGGYNPDFFSPFRSYLTRLPNGNTFISEDMGPRAFEITKDGKIVWEYVLEKESYRNQIFAADHCPQMKALKRVSAPKAVTPPANADYRVTNLAK